MGFAREQVFDYDASVVGCCAAGMVLITKVTTGEPLPETTGLAVRPKIRGTPLKAQRSSAGRHGDGGGLHCAGIGSGPPLSAPPRTAACRVPADLPGGSAAGVMRSPVGTVWDLRCRYAEDTAIVMQAIEA